MIEQHSLVVRGLAGLGTVGLALVSAVAARLNPY